MTCNLAVRDGQYDAQTYGQAHVHVALTDPVSAPALYAPVDLFT